MLNLVASLVFTTSHINDLSTKKDSEREYNYMLLCPPIETQGQNCSQAVSASDNSVLAECVLYRNVHH